MNRLSIDVAALRRPPKVFYLAGLGIAAIVLVVLGYRAVFTIPVTIDGVDARLGMTTSVADLLSAGRLHGRPGDLVAAKDHRVLRRGGGRAPRASIDGRLAAGADRLFGGAVIVSVNGSDVVEPLAKRTETYTAPASYEGSGPVETVVSDGTTGKREVTFGKVSGEVVSTKTLVAAVPAIVVRNVPGKGVKLVALTFDDGPWPKSTLQILDILKKNHIKATFFMIGEQARHSPSLAKQVAAAGMLVGNHSESHPYNMKRLSAAGVRAQIDQAQTDITKATGVRPRYFRPPGGTISPNMMPVLIADKLKLVEWDVDPTDWRKPPASTIVQRVMRQVRSGSVVLMHDGGGDRSHTVQALPEIIRRLKAAGYHFVTLDGIADLPDHM